MFSCDQRHSLFAAGIRFLPEYLISEKYFNLNTFLCSKLILSFYLRSLAISENWVDNLHFPHLEEKRFCLKSQSGGKNASMRLVLTEMK